MSKKVTENVFWHHPKVEKQLREKKNGHRAVVLWFTGLPSSGKSTIAHSVEEKLFEQNCKTFVFDGDNVRHGLCSDLGFSDVDREENLRRIGEMLKLFIQAGTIALAAFVSPNKKDRNQLRNGFAHDEFIEIHCKCSVTACEKRDSKGNYKKARQGQIKNFTGISAPYEVPENAEIVLDTERLSVSDCAEEVIDYLEKYKIFMPFNEQENHRDVL